MWHFVVNTIVAFGVIETGEKDCSCFNDTIISHVIVRSGTMLAQVCSTSLILYSFFLHKTHYFYVKIINTDQMDNRYMGEYLSITKFPVFKARR